MRILISILGWFGCMAAGCAAVLSLLAGDADDGPPDDVGTVTDSRPAAFCADGGPDDAFHHRGWDDRRSRGHFDASSSLNGGALADSRDQQRALDNLRHRRESNVPELARWAGFSGGANLLPVPPAGGATPPGAPLSFGLQPEETGTGYFLLVNNSFPNPPSGPQGSSSTGNGSSGTGDGAYYYLVGNSGTTTGGGGQDGEGGDGGFSSGGGGIWFVGGDAVPEPSSWALGFVAMGAVVFLRRRAGRAEAKP